MTKSRGWNVSLLLGAAALACCGQALAQSGAILLDTIPKRLRMAGQQQSSAVAFDGTNYLVIWQDGRGVDYDIYGARVTADGALLDPAGILIATYSGMDQESPAVVFDGTNYLVVWQEVRTRSAWDIYGARVSPQGVVLDSTGFQISSGNGDKVAPKVAWNGTNYLVVWQDMRNANWDIYGARVTRGGAVLDTSGINITPTWDRQGYPSVASDGANYFVVYEEGDDIYGTRVTSDGVVIDTLGFQVGAAPNRQCYPGVAFNGPNFLVAWEDYRHGAISDIYGARVTPGGVVLDTTGIAITTAISFQQFPSVASEGLNFLVLWDDCRNDAFGDIYGARISPGGVVLEPQGIAVSTWPSAQGGSVAAFGRDYYLIVWGAESNAFCARMLPNGSVLDPIPYNISTAATKQEHPAVASNGTNYLAVWEQEAWPEGYNIDIFGARVDTNGMMLDPKTIPIASDAGSPAVASGNTDYFVVWTGGSGPMNGITGARVTTGGVVIDTPGFFISKGPWDYEPPSIAFDGTNYLVVWEDTRSGVSWDIYGARVSSDGVVLDTAGITISTGIWDKGSPLVAFDGANYLVVWPDLRNPNFYNIFGARINSDGIVIDTNGFAISDASMDELLPSIAFDGMNYLVVYEANLTEIYGSRVSPDGVVIDTVGFPISENGNMFDQKAPGVAFDGVNYTVAWEDWRNGPYSDLYGAKVSPLGKVVDSFAVTLQPKHQTSPILVHGPGQQILVAYSGYADSVYLHPAITQRIWGKFNPGSSGVASEEGIRRLGSRAILQVYPNPFQERALVSANVPGRLKIYDALGRLVREFLMEAAKPGPLVWDGTDERGRRLPGGVYFVRLEHGGSTETKKVILLR